MWEVHNLGISAKTLDSWSKTQGARSTALEAHRKLERAQCLPITVHGWS